ncbi:uncharacterized protein FIBRA_05386 [Fibroporia radiculosa]|uniref:Uncharacterized protein n=1 Tax=Fibroporia radiculosa TaxID=599839 RepID=J4H3H0_9APHY|nr:uncharacterized protein FIBRA_05386 [Fibroporia radiculosa]CCM03259.1 predicted protein [Fibroporia radiculosa]
MEGLPAEIWMRISSLACTDGGLTGRSLARVSRYIRSVSDPFRLQNVAILRAHQLDAFANMLQSTPPERRRVRNLFVVNPCSPPPLDLARMSISQHELSSMNKKDLVRAVLFHRYRTEDPLAIRKMFGSEAEWFEEVGEVYVEWTRTLERVLRIVAQDVETMIVPLPSPFYVLARLPSDATSFQPLHDINFPVLQELSLLGPGIPPQFVSMCPRAGELQLPSLRRLHLVGCAELLTVLTGLIPLVTHLRLTNVLYLGREILDILQAAASPRRPSPEDGADTISEMPSIVRIVIVPVFSLASSGHMSRQLQTLAQSSKVILLEPSLQLAFCKIYGAADARDDWLRRIAGEEGCWEVESLR